MTVDALRIELEREEAVWGLTMVRRAETWERWELVEPLLHEHLPPRSRIRVPLTLMPVWYRNMWFDCTQVDGRAEVEDWNHMTVQVRGVSPTTLELDMRYPIETRLFLDAVLGGTIGDSS